MIESSVWRELCKRIITQRDDRQNSPDLDFSIQSRSQRREPLSKTTLTYSL